MRPISVLSPFVSEPLPGAFLNSVPNLFPGAFLNSVPNPFPGAFLSSGFPNPFRVVRFSSRFTVHFHSLAFPRSVA
jgi:hypothetical protein